MSIYVVFKVEFKLVRTCLVIVGEEGLMIDNIKNGNLNGGVCSIDNIKNGIICNKRSIWIMKVLASVLFLRVDDEFSSHFFFPHGLYIHVLENGFYFGIWFHQIKYIKIEE